MLTTSGEVELKVPKLRKLSFETAIIERYKRRECSVEEALRREWPELVATMVDMTEQTSLFP